ncbi:MAG: hypothetical protein IH946_02465 [Bacteroidetes bacterium]|nr:hypothetical protein [Bacteroidota bacterium]
MRNYLLPFLFTLITLNAFPQEEDSVVVKFDASDIYYYKLSDPRTYLNVDTGVDSIHLYKIVQRKSYVDVGNNGSAHKPLIYKPNTDIGLDVGFHQLDLYYMNADDLRFYKTKPPFTRLYYVLGPKDEQNFKVTHTQNLKPNHNFGINYYRMATNGFYRNQNTSNTVLDIFSDYRSKNNRYNIRGGFIYNKILSRENGGVVDDSLFDKTSVTKETETVNLQTSAGGTGPTKGATNRWIGNQVYLESSRDFGFTYPEQINDSTIKYHYQGSTQLGHRLNVGTRRYVYRDYIPDIGFYDTILIDSFLTADSIHHYNIDNTIYYRSTGIKDKTIDTIIPTQNIWELALMHSYFEVNPKPFPYTTSYNKLIDQNLIASAFIRTNPMSSSSVVYGIKGSYALTGYNITDYVGQAWLGYQTEKLGLATVGIMTKSFKAPYLYNGYHSNNFSWSNILNKTTESALNINYQLDKHSLYGGWSYGIINGLIWLDSTSSVQQKNVNIQRVNFFFKKGFKLKRLHLDIGFTYQEFSDKTVLHLPKVITFNSLYYQGPLFNNAVLSRIGLDLHYYSDHYADGYTPAIGQFTVQNSTKLTYYPVADLFMNIKLKKTS